MSKLVKLLVIAVLLTTGAAFAQDWHIEIVDQVGLVGRFNTLVLDDYGYPHISYYDNSNYDLKYAHWDGDNWLIETVDSAGDVGQSTSLALDSTGYPHISYKGGGLKYAYWDGDEWQIETVDSSGDTGSFSSLVLDSSGYAHISYRNNIGKYLKYAHWDGDDWQIEIVEDDMGWGISLALDDSDHPHISYSDYTNRDLKYARWDGDTWQIEIVDSEGIVGTYSSLELNDSDNAHISYYDNSNYDLKYARWNGSSWLIETVDSYGDVGWFTSLALDSNEYPHISYKDDTNFDLKYARWDGDNWQIEIVDSYESAGCFNFLMLDDYDQPHISYFNYTSWDLRYAWYGVPGSFHLLWPESGEVITTTTPTLDWGFHNLPGFDSYTLWWGMDPDFNTYNEETGIVDSQHQITSGIEDGDTVYWRVKSLYGSGEFWAEEMDWCFVVDLGTGINVEPEGQGLFLSDPYPSPTSYEVTFAYILPGDSRAIISVYDLCGRRVAKLVDDEFTAGRHEASWNCSVIPSGVYLCRLVAEDRSVIKRLLVSR